MSETAIRADGLGVEYHLNLDGQLSLRRDGLRAFKVLLDRKKKSEFWALRDVSFEVGKGEIFGIMGGNGAGKSTLLKVLAGIVPPTAGTVDVRGTVAPLIELGAAINPELTGAENIFLAGSLYKVPRKEVRQEFGRIVDFAGLRRFIETPVKNYSSGMFVRLAFSTIIFFKPDVVLIDEVFSVGDEVFQQKSFEKILSYKEQGATIVIVSHDLNLLNQICGRALLLSRGRAAFVGPVDEAAARYRELVRGGEGLDAERGAVGKSRGAEKKGKAAEVAVVETAEEAARLIAAGAELQRWGNRRVEILGVTFVDAEGRPVDSFRTGERFEARISYVSRLPENERPVFGAAIITAHRSLIYGPNTLEAGWPGEKTLPERGTIRLALEDLPLFPGEYLFTASVYDQNLRVAYDHHEMLYRFKVTGGPAREIGLVRLRSRWDVEPV
jgi:ABC-type polysaccharide/polyol phosphate transport system ATPase subunit